MFPDQPLLLAKALPGDHVGGVHPRHLVLGDDDGEHGDDDEHDDDGEGRLGHDCLGRESFVHRKVRRLLLEP